MPDWLIAAGTLLTFAGGGAAWGLHSGPKVAQPVESLDQLFERCAVETRGTAIMWERLDQHDLAVLHHNLVAVYRAYGDVYQQADAPNAPKVSPVEAGLVTINESRAVEHGWQWTEGCRCKSCYAEYSRRYLWPTKG